jgi:uncharacterized membrane protein
MDLTNRETWTALHGIVFGALFLLAFAGGLAGLWSLRPEWVTVNGLQERMLRLKAGVVGMAVVAWLTVIAGTWIVYPWYRDAPPEGTTDLTDYPRYFLLDDPNLDQWHKFGMEWKEHVAWIAPILATIVAFIVVYYGNQLIVDKRLRYVAMTLFVMAFVTAGIAGLMGAFITKAAPIQ